MAIESSPLLYSSREEVASILSTVGIDLRIDDSDDGTVDAAEEQLLTDAIEEATDIINEAALHFYTAEELETSRWIRRRASYLAAHIIGKRRGNPSIYCEYVEEIKGELERLMGRIEELERGQ